MTANDGYAAQLLAQADELMNRRRVLLTASVALSTTNNVAAARRTLAGWEGGPPRLIAEAVAVIDALQTAAAVDLARETAEPA